MSSSTGQQQEQATNRSIDQTKENIHRAIEEVRRETPRYSQTVTDFQNETADVTREVADSFLDSQKEVMNSFQSVWTPILDSQKEVMNSIQSAWSPIVQKATNITAMPLFSPQQMAEIYTRTIGAMTEAYVASTRMATNMMFAGLEATRATTNYTRQNAKEASRVTSNTAKAFAQTAKETVQVQGGGESSSGGSAGGGEQKGGGESSSGGGGGGSAGGAGRSTASTTESKGGSTSATTTTHTGEGTMPASGTGTGSTTTTTTTGAVNLSDTVPRITEKTRKKF